MKGRWVALLLTVTLAVYLVLVADRAVLLLRSGRPVGVVLGCAVLALPAIGVWIVFATWRFGSQSARLVRRLADEGDLPDTSGLPRMPSGRVQRAAADEWFAERVAEIQTDPDNWRCWVKLAHAYDIAGDRRRAREAMRKALDLTPVAGRSWWT